MLAAAAERGKTCVYHTEMLSLTGSWSSVRHGGRNEGTRAFGAPVTLGARKVMGKIISVGMHNTLHAYLLREHTT